MNVYKISCHSDCGTYFMHYLQSVTVIAESPEHAVTLVKKWLKEEGHEFIKLESEWKIILESDARVGVINYHRDADY